MQHSAAGSNTKRMDWLKQKHAPSAKCPLDNFPVTAGRLRRNNYLRTVAVQQAHEHAKLATHACCCHIFKHSVASCKGVARYRHTSVGLTKCYTHHLLGQEVPNVMITTYN